MDETDLTEAVADLAHNAKRIAEAITPIAAVPVHDAAGGSVGSLTEAVMGLTAGAVRIADALESIAEAIRTRPQPDTPR